MKKQYYFILPIIIMFYLIWLVLGNTYNNYKVNSKIKFYENYNSQTKQKNDFTKQEIAYFNTNAYKEKILKSEQNMINKGEKVIIITPKIEKEIKKIEVSEFIAPKSNNNKIIQNMDNLDKWIYVFTKKS
ncbi:MAG: septum formation initiator family protein [Candidatus Gracilibacteria bacterium]|nr:septum formation initiator family protein [Candidatus Gracilibacteria bacterium]